MSRFLKLTNIVFNANDIHKIVIEPNKYCIYIVSKQLEGLSVSFGGFGYGNINSITNTFEVCQTKHSTDYKIVSDWINNI
jgi:hypothetical protein